MLLIMKLEEGMTFNVTLFIIRDMKTDQSVMLASVIESKQAQVNKCARTYAHKHLTSDISQVSRKPINMSL
jgi:hypothetical protein